MILVNANKSKYEVFLKFNLTDGLYFDASNIDYNRLLDTGLRIKLEGAIDAKTSFMSSSGAKACEWLRGIYGRIQYDEYSHEQNPRAKKLKIYEAMSAAISKLSYAKDDYQERYAIEGDEESFIWVIRTTEKMDTENLAQRVVREIRTHRGHDRFLFRYICRKHTDMGFTFVGGRTTAEVIYENTKFVIPLSYEIEFTDEYPAKYPRAMILKDLVASEGRGILIHVYAEVQGERIKILSYKSYTNSLEPHILKKALSEITVSSISSGMKVTAEYGLILRCEEYWSILNDINNSK